MNLMTVLRMSDDEARELLESIRWPEGPVCPHCGGMDRVCAITGKSARPGLRECACRPYGVARAYCKS